MQTLARTMALMLALGVMLLAGWQIFGAASVAAKEDKPTAAKKSAAPVKDMPEKEAGDDADSQPVAKAASKAAGRAADQKDATESDPEVAEPNASLPVVNSIYILVLAGFVGFEVIRQVSPLLHTPLMSATNAISGISLVGSLVAAGNSHLGGLSNFLGFVAVTAATINVVGGFMITDRMLKMFKLRGKEQHG